MLNVDKSHVKLGRACERISDIGDILIRNRPFRYVLQTDVESFQRSTYAKPNQAVLDNLAVACGEVANSLRSALDYTYWSIVSPFATNERERKAIMFPFCERSDRLDEAVKNRLANRVSSKFFDAVVALRPYHESGGNTLLCLIDRVAVEDKHRNLTPVADYAHIPGRLLQELCPDAGLITGGMKFFGCHRHMAWAQRIRPGEDLGEAVPPYMNVFEKEIDVPVPAVFPVFLDGEPAPLIPTLNKMVDVAKQAIANMRAASS